MAGEGPDPSGVALIGGEPPVPDFLPGAWKRLYFLDDGKPDRTVNVRNIQTPSLFGDCRVPKDRPEYPQAKRLGDLTDEQLETLWNQDPDHETEGFSGYTTVEGLISTWHHVIRYQPPDGSLDIGRLEFTGGRNMFEHGVQSVYTEHWWHLEDGDGQFLGVWVMKKHRDGTQRVHQILSVAGDHFVYARNRPFDLPMADSMKDLIVKTRAKRERIIRYLDCEVSTGFVQGGEVPWQIQFSTLPYRRGEPLRFASRIEVDRKTGALSLRARRDKVAFFPINTLALGDLLVLFPPGRDKPSRSNKR